MFEAFDTAVKLKVRDIKLLTNQGYFGGLFVLDTIIEQLFIHFLNS